MLEKIKTLAYNFFVKLNKNYYFSNDFEIENNIFVKKKTPFYTKLFWIVFGVFVFVFCCYFAFSTIFFRAQVIGISMKPTYNINLPDEIKSKEYYENSIYKDVVYVNRFNKGKNGDIVLIDLGEEIIIKRIIALAGQEIRLQKRSENNFFDFYVDGELLVEDYIYNDMGIEYFNKFCDNKNLEVEVVESGVSAKIIVPENCVFALGDNRFISEDSSILGGIEIDKILGKVAFSYEYNQTFWSFIWGKICAVM